MQPIHANVNVVSQAPANVPVFPVDVRLPGVTLWDTARGKPQSLHAAPLGHVQIPCRGALGKEASMALSFMVLLGKSFEDIQSHSLKKVQVR